VLPAAHPAVFPTGVPVLQLPSPCPLLTTSSVLRCRSQGAHAEAGPKSTSSAGSWSRRASTTSSSTPTASTPWCWPTSTGPTEDKDYEKYSYEHLRESSIVEHEGIYEWSVYQEIQPGTYRLRTTTSSGPRGARRARHRSSASTASRLRGLRLPRRVQSRRSRPRRPRRAGEVPRPGLRDGPHPGAPHRV